jgi:hypothetical protein
MIWKSHINNCCCGVAQRSDLYVVRSLRGERRAFMDTLSSESWVVDESRVATNMRFSRIACRYKVLSVLTTISRHLLEPSSTSILISFIVKYTWKSKSGVGYHGTFEY